MANRGEADAEPLGWREARRAATRGEGGGEADRVTIAYVVSRWVKEDDCLKAFWAYVMSTGGYVMGLLLGLNRVYLIFILKL